MRFPFFKSIHAKIIISITLVFTVSLGLGAYFITTTQKKQRLMANQRKLEVIEATIERSFAYAMAKGRSEEVQSTLELVGRQRYIKKLRIFSDSGTILRSSRRDEIGDQVEQFYVEALDNKNYRFLSRPEGEVYPVNTLIQPIFNQPECYSCHDPEEKITGVLEIGISLEYAYKDLTMMYRSIGVTVGISWLCMTIFGIFLQFKIVREPLTELIVKMGRVKAGDLNVRVELESNDELGTIGKNFNEMVDKLNQAQEKIKDVHQQQMARVDRLASIGEMAAGLAHEIRNPLAGISGAIQVISSDFDAHDPKKEIVNEIIKQIDRVNNTIKDILAYSRPPSPQFKTASLCEVMDESIFLANPAAINNKVKIERLCDPDDAKIPEVLIDPGQIQQVFLNICLNAIQAMPTGGNLYTRAKFLKGEDGDKVAIMIEDSGAGMTQEILEKIFDPFYSTKHRGTGLGLSVAQTIIKQHGGEISVQSDEGKGSVFTITFPVAYDFTNDKNYAPSI